MSGGIYVDGIPIRFAPTFHVFALFLLRNTFTAIHMCQTADWLCSVLLAGLQDVPIQEPDKDLLLWEPNCAGRDHWWILANNKLECVNCYQRVA
jgi:hypothetical protein